MGFSLSTRTIRKSALDWPKYSWQSDQKETPARTEGCDAFGRAQDWKDEQNYESDN